MSQVFFLQFLESRFLVFKKLSHTQLKPDFFGLIIVALH
jgi:hypothetical protein